MAEHRKVVRFELEWRLTLFTLILVPTMISLGFWQLQRAEEKRELADSYQQRELEKPAELIDLRELPDEDLAYRRVRLQGRIVPGRYFLLDNSLRSGRFGYEVLALLDTDAGPVLVNRGWLAGDPARRSLPLVPELPGEVELTGYVYVSPGKPYLLGEQQLQGDWPKVIQAVEMDRLRPLVDEGLFPYPVRLLEGQAGALQADWPIVNVSPEKHRGYSVQWFTMAAVLTIFFLLRSSNLWVLVRARKLHKD